MRNEDSSVKSFVKLIYKLAPELKGLFLVFLMFVIIYEAVKFVPPYLVQLIIDNLIEGANSEYLTFLVILTFIVLTILTFIHMSQLTRVFMGAYTSQKNILKRIFAKLLNLPLDWHEKQNTGNLVSKINKASGYINQLVWFVSHDILPSLVQLILTGAVLFWVDYRIGLIYLVFSPLILYTVDKQFKKVQPIRNNLHDNYDLATEVFAQSLYNIKTVKDYVNEEKEKKEHENFLSNFLKYASRRTNLEYWQITYRELLTNFVRALSMGVSVYLVVIGEMTAGELVFVFTIIEKAYINLHRLGRVYTFMGDTYESLRRALDVQESENVLKDEGKGKFKETDISFENVNFSYHDEIVLKDMSLIIPKKKTTAIVGPSGAGKTTLVKLLMRHYDVSSGRIVINNKDIRDIKLNDLRRNIAFVSQHTELFDRTIYENIGYGSKSISKKEIIKAAKKANAHEFIMTFKNSYDTIVGERGVRLSGGQQQRIAIARALASKANVIVFDEATSSLDSESEKQIQKAMLGIKNKTVIIIAHRFSTIAHADKIVVLKDGQILEQGTHKELLNKNKGLYKNMRELQKLGDLRD